MGVLLRRRRAALTAGEPGADYVVGGDNAPQLRAFEIVRDLTGRPLPRRIPAPLAHVLGAVEEIRALGGATPKVTRGTVRILTHDWPLDSARSIQKLSYHVTPLETGLRTLLSIRS